MSQPPPQMTLAALDLGSNSFHMLVARLEHGLPVIIDRIRENVRLAAGLDAEKNLSEDACIRAISALQRFGERLRDLPEENVRAVGTNTLRKAKNGREFLTRARRVLGKDIEVISGREEARMIYLGVAHSVDQSARRRLVVDIGGGSTELIVGERFDPLERDSVQMGCVRYTRKFFPKGEITRHAMDQARLSAQLELRSLQRHYRGLGWDQCLGSSGTIKAVDDILRALGLPEAAITAEGLEGLEKRLVDQGHVDGLSLPSMKPDRAAVLPAGLAILRAVFESLRIDRMTVSSGALREGILYDLLGRIRSEDVRNRTIRIFQSRYNVDREFAARLERTTLALFEQGAESWDIDSVYGRQFLSWAVQLHEIGLSLSHGGYHRHGAYLIRNSDMRGFSRDDQEMVAAVVLGSRRRLRRDRLMEVLPDGRVELALRLAVFLRLARRLHRSRSSRAVPEVKATFEGDTVSLTVPEGWLKLHPLTRADLEDEAHILQDAGIVLQVV
ncbi:MAG: exopolyphosphatase [Myxococcota bacterium]|nr:exopolyphosphatase [Myxococcota bacterium]